MANHDFNRPCDCRECRSTTRQIFCPACKACHVVEIDRIPEWKTDRKGMSYVDFQTPEASEQSLVCVDCGHNIEGIDYYTRYDAAGTRSAREYLKKKAEAEKCQECGKLEDIDWATGFLEMIRLTERDGAKLCQSCLADKVQMETPDPSDEAQKFVFDRRALTWNLDKVKVPCVKCGRQRWLNAKNKWRNLCGPCFRMR